MGNVVHHIQPSFAGGELSPGLYSRVDIQRYMAGLKTARNVHVLPQGGVRNRAGTYHVGAAGDSDHAVRVVPFVYSSGQSYVIEFGHEYLRFFTNDAQVMDPDTPEDPYEIASPYTEDELFELKFASSGSYLYIFHKNHRPQVLQLNSDSTWSLSDFIFKRGPFMLMNTAQARTITPSSATPSTTNKTVQFVGSGGAVPGPYTIYIDTSTAHGLTTGDEVTFSALDGDGAFLNGNTYTALVVSTSRIRLYYPGTYDLVTYPDLIGYTPTTGTLTYNVPITLTSNFDVFDSLHVGALFQLIDTLPSDSVTLGAAGGDTSSLKCGTTFRLITNDNAAGTPWTGDVTVSVSTDNGATWSVLTKVTSVPTGGISQNHDTSGETGASQCLVKATINCTAGAVKVTLESLTFDWVSVVQILGVTDSRTASANIITYEGIGSGIGNTDPKFQWSEGSWSDYRGWPAVGTFFQDRLVTASTENEPETLWLSQVADYQNYGMSSTVVDSDAITVVLNSRTINTIRNLSPLTGLVINTSDSDFSISSASGVITPTSIQQICHGHRGSSEITPAIVGNEIILAQPMGSTIRNLIYQFAVQGYMGDNISVMSQHLFSGYSIVEMAYQQEPDSIVWAVRDDGVMLSLSYMREQEVIAWTRHDTDGEFESVCCIPNETLGINEVWVVVKRTIGESTVRFIERFASRDMGDSVADYMILDCAVSATNSPASATISGLDHLEGEVVNALCDGFVVKDLTVSGGEVTLPYAASKVHVGLPFVSDVETLPIELQNQNGTSQGRKATVPRATLRVWNSRGGYCRTTSQESAPASSGVSGFDEVKEGSPGEEPSTAIPLQTRDYLVPLNGGYSYRTSIMFRQVDPLPFCITAIIPQVSQGGN